MIRALKVALIVYGVITIFFGLLFMFSPRELGASQGYESSPKYVGYFLALLGYYMIVPAIFLIIAARDPIRHINWVRFAIVWTLASVVTSFYSLMRGYVTFSQVELALIVDGGFAVAFLVLYPWRTARLSKNIHPDKP